MTLRLPYREAFFCEMVITCCFVIYLLGNVEKKTYLCTDKFNVLNSKLLP